MKRLLAFLLLLGLGFVVLRWAIGDDALVTAGGTRGPGEPDEPRGRSGFGTGRGGASIEQRGPFQHAKTRAIPLPGGGARHERIYLIDAKDSQPVRGGLQQLDRVDITLFDKDVPAAVITARQAFVELGRDAHGRPSLREDKEIDLRDVVLRTLPGARLEGLRLELGNARVRVGEAHVQIDTATESDPVLLTVEGKQHGTLRGRGLEARLPRDRHGAMQRVDIDILHEPVLETAGLVVRGRQRMHYAEDLATGAAEVAVADAEIHFTGEGLQLSGTGKAPAGGTKKATIAKGDQLLGWLLRGTQRGDDGQEHERMLWRLLRLNGSPVQVDGDGLHVTTKELTVLPGASGEPFLVTASGGASRVDLEVAPTATRPAPVRVSGTSPHRIHLVRPVEQTGALHRMFGFPQWTLRPAGELHAVVFEGRSRLEDPTRDLEASNGLQLFHTDPAHDAVIGVGFGDVRIHQRAQKPHEKDLHAAGNDGFFLRSTPEHDRLDLGPPLPADPDAGDVHWQKHRYELRQGAMTANGTGACRLTREQDRTKLALRAPGTEIEAALPGDGGRLTGVRRLEAEFDDHAVHALRVVGLPAMATITHRGETLVARAPLLERLGQASLCLLPRQPGPDEALWRGLAEVDALPRLQRSRPARPRRGAELADARAPRIEVHHLGGEHLFVDAQSAGDVPARIDATFEPVDGGQQRTVELEAHRLRVFPFALTPTALLAHTGGAAGLAAQLPFQPLQSPWLFGEQVRRLVVRDDEQGLVEGSGHELLLSSGAEAGLFTGDPTAMTPAKVQQTKKGRVVTATGARVRVFRDEPSGTGAADDGVRLQALRTFAGRSAFLLPTVELHQPGTDEFAHLRAVCRGDIDVRNDRIEFLGPVVANSLDADGAEAEGGLHIVADELQMKRRIATGEITRVIGHGVRAEWQGVRARSAEMELELGGSEAKQNIRCTVRDPADATVDFPDGRRLTATHATVDFRTLAYAADRGKLEHTKPKVEPR